MDSDAKQGRTGEDSPTLLRAIREKLRPVLLRKWRRSRADALASAAEGGLTEEERDLFLAGHQAGYWQGALDAAAIKPSDLRPVPPPKTEKIH